MKLSHAAKYLLPLCLVLPVPAFAQSRDALQTAQHLVTACGLSVQLPGFVGQMKQQMAQQRGQVSAEVMVMLADAATEAFRADVLEADIVADLAKRLPPDEMNRVIAWLETPTGRRVTRAEEAASTMDSVALQKFIEQMKSNSPAETRVSLIREVISATYVESIIVRSMQAMALGMALGMDSTLPVERRVGMARIEAMVKSALPEDKLREQLRASLPPTYLYTYRNVSDEDLHGYVSFLSTATGQHYSEQTTEAFMGALVRASVRLGKLVDQRTVKRSV